MAALRDLPDSELLYVAIWFVGYGHEGNKMVRLLDGNSANVAYSMGFYPLFENRPLAASRLNQRF